MEGESLIQLPCSPVALVLIHEMAPVATSLRNTSDALFVSPGTRFEASLTNNTKRPSALIEEYELDLLLCSPLELVLIHEMAPVATSLRNMSNALFVSPGTRLEAPLRNTTNRPSALMEGETGLISLCSPVALALIIEIAPVAISLQNMSNALFVSPGTR